jgi:hypothetical protein
MQFDTLSLHVVNINLITNLQSQSRISFGSLPLRLSLRLRLLNEPVVAPAVPLLRRKGRPDGGGRRLFFSSTV